MSLISDIIGGVVSGVVGGGGDSVTVTNTNTATTDVTVNPEIVTINTVDFDPIRQMIADLTVPAQQREAEASARLEKIQDETIDTLRLTLAGGALLFVLIRKGVL